MAWHIVIYYPLLIHSRLFYMRLYIYRKMSNHHCRIQIVIAQNKTSEFIRNEIKEKLMFIV